MDFGALGNFAALPPEVISGRMYSGPGAEPLLAAASAWEELTAELHSAATQYASVLSSLTSGWQGTSAAAAASAAAPYVTWMSTTATQIEETASQAKAAASAYEAAFAATVPPPVIAANRSQLASLVASNIFGQNTAAIAATEAQYSQMWAQDVATMLGYSSSSTAATRLTAFTAPPQTTNSSGVAAQPAAATAATRTAPLSDAQTLLQQTLQGINSLTSGYTSEWESLIAAVTGSSQSASLWESLESFMSSAGGQSGWVNTVHSTHNLGISQFKNFYRVPAPPAIPKSALGGGLVSSGLAGGGALTTGLTAATSASAGTASTVGALSVPTSWASATPAIRLASVALPSTVLAAAPAADLSGGLLNSAALGGLTGGALGGPVTRVGTTGIQVMATNTKNRNAPVKLDQLITQLQQTPDVVQHWNVDQAGLDDLVAKLSLKPGIHAVHVCTDGEIADARPQSALA